MTRFTDVTFNNDKLAMLLAYLDRLHALNTFGYNCSREIAECIKEIRGELELEKPVKFYTPEMLRAMLSDVEGDSE